MKKLLNEVNRYIPGELRIEGSRFVWYVDDKPRKKVSFGSKTNAWWLLKGIMLMKKLCQYYTEIRNAQR